MVRSIPLAFFALTFIAPISESCLVNHAQEAPPPVDIVVTEVSGRLFVLRGTYANMLVSIGDDGVLLVDDDMAPLTEKLRATIAGLSGNVEGIPTFILNTHWHGDHTGGNEAFGAEDSTIIAHENTRKRLMTPQEMLGQRVEPIAKDGWPIITFDRSIALYFNDDVIKVIHHPLGHTDGDAVIHFTKANVVHMGDLYFEGYFPNIDLGSGGSVRGYLEAVEAVLAVLPDDAVVIPGHGPIAAKADLQRFAQMLREVTAHVADLIEAGRSREAVIALGPPETWAYLNTPQMTAERFLGTVYDSLAETSKP